jgi:hypothetical protein
MKSQTQISVLFLAVLMLLRSLVVPVLCLDYELRKEYIAKYYCINKNNPQLHCDGKCYLAKRLAAAQEQEQRQAEREFFQRLLEVPAVLEYSSFGLFAAAWSYLPSQASFCYKSLLAEGIAGGLFHPPAQV